MFARHARESEWYDTWSRPRQAGVDVAATLRLELHLLAVDCSAADRVLPTAPAAAAPRGRLSAADADYLRVLTFRPEAVAIPAARAAMPVRLLPRITSTVIEAAAASADLEEAIRWETAALLEGRTIGELGLLLALGSA